MANEKLEKLLEDVARRMGGPCRYSIGCADAGDSKCVGCDLTDAYLTLLKRRLLPLLEAGQAMVEWEADYRALNNLGKVPPHPFQQHSAALAAALGK